MRKGRIFEFIVIMVIAITSLALIDAILSGQDKTSGVAYKSNVSLSDLAYPYPYEIRDRPMSVDEAAYLVRAFNHTPNADMKQIQNWIISYYGDEYLFESGNTFFTINPITGQVTSMWVRGGPGMNQSISMDRAKSIAANYVRTHYRGFGTMKGMVLNSSQLNDFGSGGKEYTFDWQEYINSMPTLNRACVRIDADTGAVLYYYGLELPVPAPLKQTISREQAVTIALAKLGNNFTGDDARACLDNGTSFNMTFTINQSAMGDPLFTAAGNDTTVTYVNASQRFVYNGNQTQRQVWYVVIDEMHPVVVQVYGEGYQPAMDGHRWWISVDACTGEIVNIARCF